MMTTIRFPVSALCLCLLGFAFIACAGQEDERIHSEK
jgi:hypothetical protein